MTLDREKRPTIRERLAQASGTVQDQTPGTGEGQGQGPGGGAMSDKVKSWCCSTSRISSSCISLTSSVRVCGWRLGRTPRRSCSTSGRAFQRPSQVWHPVSICWICAWARRRGADPAGGLLQRQEREEIPPGDRVRERPLGHPGRHRSYADPDFFQNVSSLRRNGSPCRAAPRSPSMPGIKTFWSLAVPAAERQGSLSSQPAPVPFLLCGH